jgi:GrpB-like predicted nucleotidyltransferase (UPF0157 family)
LSPVDLFLIRYVDRSLLCEERHRVLSLTKDVIPVASVMEVGSTAVEGVIGKEDIDILVRVPRELFGEARSTLDRRFKRNAYQMSNEEYQGYLIESPLDVAIQLTVTGGKFDRFERFVDLLRSNAALRTAYNDLKRAWNGRPMDQYRSAKAEFIERVLESSTRSSKSKG